MGGLSLFSIPVDATGESTRLVRWSAFVVLVLFGGAVAWGALAPISGAVVAGGIIKVDTNRKSVQHLEGGIIREILVREGERVEAGQPLILLEDTDRSADLNILSDTLHAHLAKEARLVAEASLSDAVDFPDELRQETSDKTQALIRNELALFQARRKTLLDQIELTEDEISHADEAVHNLQGQIASTQNGLALIGQQLAAAEKLVEKRAIDKNSILELKRKVADQNESLWEQKAELALRRQSVAGLKLRIVNLKNDYANAAEDELKENRQQIFETRERIRPVLDALQRKTIRAAIAGQVINLRATTVGGVIKPGETVAEIVPASRDLVFEVHIKPADSDSVYVGQSAMVQFSAYNQRTTPMVAGRLSYVSGDALTDDTGSDRQPYFLAHVVSDPEALQRLGDRPLSPGMPVIAYVQTEPRTFFEYLFSPITSGLRQALVEDVH